ncbi:hypothetical protein [uncultured Megamonas sp.]|uniref:hypothetical protein n=1 Tax=uncultured Megamonas sp. TaxID=286140 RepID=UPI00266F033C|nr:hypothetical protein [uncultured Megamonas sp.]
MVLWQFVPQIHVLPHVIYFEWIICIISFLIISVVDKQPIKIVEKNRYEEKVLVKQEVLSR